MDEFLLAQDTAAHGGAIWLGLLAMLALLCMSAAFSCSEAVLFSLTPLHLQRDAGSRNPLRRLTARLMGNPKRTLIVILTGNTTVNILLFATSFVVFSELALRHGAWVHVAAGVGSVLLVLMGAEVVPKVIGVSMAPTLAPLAAALIHTSGLLLRPLIVVLDALVIEPIHRICFGRGSAAPEPDHELTSEELKMMLEMSRQQGVINPLEGAFLREVIDLSYLRVRDVMAPRVEMAVYDVAASRSGLLALMRATRRKKIPVYEKTPDNIIGLIHAKNLYFDPQTPLRQLVQPVRFVPELVSCEQVLHHFRSTRSQLAIAVDEYGGVAGLVTLHDILERIVGDIGGPDEAPAEAEINPLGDGVYEVAGRLHVSYLTQMLRAPRLLHHVVTIGGLVTAELGRVAQVGDVVRVSNVEFEVMALRGRSVERVRVRRVDRAAGKEARV